jgi:hypothetical protein
MAVQATANLGVVACPWCRWEKRPVRLEAEHRWPNGAQAQLFHDVVMKTPHQAMELVAAERECKVAVVCHLASCAGAAWPESGEVADSQEAPVCIVERSVILTQIGCNQNKNQPHANVER